MTEKLKKTLLLIYRWIYRIIFGYARISLVAVVGIVSAQVVARNIFKSNIRWNQEVALLLTIWMAFLGLSIGVDKGLHIKVELFFSMFPKAVQKALDRLNQILLLLVGLFFTYYGTALILSTTHSKMTVTRWPALHDVSDDSGCGRHDDLFRSDEDAGHRRRNGRAKERRSLNMNGIAIAILLLTFVFLLVIKCPITFSMVISTSLAMLYLDIPVMTMVQQMCKQLNSFTLLAIPFFILMGELMAQGGISSRLLKFADVCVGRFTGGLAHVNVLASMLFGGISGSAIADVSSLGVIEIPMMTDAGYDVDFSTAVTVTSACQGLIIPPSHNMVLYAMVAGGVSVGKLFCAGYVPGILLGVSLMVCCYFISKKKNYGKGKKLPLKEALAVTKDTVLAMLAMVIVIGGVSAGVFTTTESAAIACLYCAFIGLFVYRQMTLKDIPAILGRTVKTLAMIYGLIAAAGAFGWMMTYLNVPQIATNFLLSVSTNKYVILLLINIILLVLGCFMDLTPLVLIMTPILLPVVKSFGMDPVQFGVVMMLNLGIGLCTPPVGTALFTGCAIAGRKIESVSKATLPLYVPMLVVLLLVTYIPGLTMALPNLLMK